MNEVDSIFQARMRALAQKGGATTKRRHGGDPRYYRRIGRLGGKASVAARKAQMAAEPHGVNLSEAPIVEPSAPVEVPRSTARRASTMSEILADLERPSSHVSDASNRRQSPADLQAERDFARWVARIRQEEGCDLEPWDPWSNRW